MKLKLENLAQPEHSLNALYETCSNQDSFDYIFSDLNIFRDNARALSKNKVRSRSILLKFFETYRGRQIILSKNRAAWIAELAILGSGSMELQKFLYSKLIELRREYPSVVCKDINLAVLNGPIKQVLNKIFVKIDRLDSDSKEAFFSFLLFCITEMEDRTLTELVNAIYGDPSRKTKHMLIFLYGALLYVKDFQAKIQKRLFPEKNENSETVPDYMDVLIKAIELYTSNDNGNAASSSAPEASSSFWLPKKVNLLMEFIGRYYHPYIKSKGEVDQLEKPLLKLLFNKDATLNPDELNQLFLSANLSMNFLSSLIDKINNFLSMYAQPYANVSKSLCHLSQQTTQPSQSATHASLAIKHVDAKDTKKSVVEAKEISDATKMPTDISDQEMANSTFGQRFRK